MSEFSDAVRLLAQAASTLNAAASSQHTGQGAQTVNLGAQPQAPATPGGLSGAQQVQALNSALGQTVQSAQQATSSLNTASRSAAGFFGNFAESRIHALGFSALRVAIGAVSDEVQRFISVPSAFEAWERATGRLPQSTQTLENFGTEVATTRQELEALAFTPAFDVIQQKLNDTGTTSGPTRLEQAASGLGTFLEGAANAAFDLGDAVTGAQAKIRELLGNPKIELFAPVEVNPNALAMSQSIRDAARETVELNADMARLNDGAIALRDNYDAAVKPLRDQLDALNKQYQTQQQQKALTDLNRNIAQDQLLAVDVLSSAGQAANQALPNELARRTDLQAQLDHQAEVDRLQAQIDYQTDNYNTLRDANERLRRETGKQLAGAAAGVSVEEQKATEVRQAEAFTVETVTAQHQNDPHDTRPMTAAPPWQPVNQPYVPNTSGPGASFRDRGVDNLGAQRLSSTVTVNLNLNGVTVGGNKTWVRTMLDDPEFKTWLSQAAAGK
jgi:hypothetical protein